MGVCFLVLAVAPFVTPGRAGGGNPQKSGASSAADRLGLTCAQILQMTSSDWVAKFDNKSGQTPEATARAAAAYGRCYDARTDGLAGSLARKGSAPRKTARTDFADFERTLKAFALKAIADAQPPPGATKTAYITLYEKEFRYDFYRAYAEKNVNRALSAEEGDQFAKAKNRFGELLGLLPEDQGHELHEAFGNVIGTHPVSLPMKLALYRYAIYILEPPSGKPFAPPPF
jgi:hypothetical protein